MWHHPGWQVPIHYVLVRDVAGAFRPQAVPCTDLDADPSDILRWPVHRSSIEVTFAEVRRHRDVESPRQWSDAVIRHTTPVLLGLFSLITLLADDLFRDAHPVVRAASWHTRSPATFSDAIASVRGELCTHGMFKPRASDTTGQNCHQISSPACSTQPANPHEMAKIRLKARKKTIS